MSQAIWEFYSTQRGVPPTDTINPEGFPAYTATEKERYVQILMTNTVGNTFYASAFELAEISIQLHELMSATDPEFMAKALCYARNKGFMRLQPILGLAILSKRRTDLAEKVFDKIILTGNDLQDYVQIMRGRVVSKGLGRASKRMINNWLNNMSEYHAVKYRSGGKGYSLKDIIRLTHPVPSTPIQSKLFLYLTDPKSWKETHFDKNYTSLPMIKAVEELKMAETTEEQSRWIEEGRIPHEIATGIVKSPSTELWTSIMRQMPYFALLKNLNTLQRAGVTKDPQNVNYIVDRLTDRQAIRNSKVLPFRFLTAHKMFKPQLPMEAMISDALYIAIDHAVVGTEFDGLKAAIGVDVSGSMTGGFGRGSTTYMDIGSLFASALYKQLGPTTMVLPFDTRLHQIGLSTRDTVMTNAKRISNLGGGGTNLDLPLEHLLQHRIPVDIFIGITDNIEWAGSGFYKTWLKYKSTVAGKNAKAFLIRIDPYNARVAPPSAEDVFFVYGWSDTVIDYVTYALGGETQVDTIEKLEL